jgi:hypothetical protein
MTAKKRIAKGIKKSGALTPRRKAAPSALAGNGAAAEAGKRGNGAAKKRARPKNGKAAQEESEAVRKANELTLRAWESVYARRDELKELYWVK